MPRYLSVLAMAAYLAAPAVSGAQEPAASAVQPPPVREIRIVGTKELSQDTGRESLPVRLGEPFTETLQTVAHAVERRYRDEGYTFARAKIEFEAPAGQLTIAIDEGVIDGVE